jgi:hypothetical protein
MHLSLATNEPMILVKNKCRRISVSREIFLHNNMIRDLCGEKSNEYKILIGKPQKREYLGNISAKSRWKGHDRIRDLTFSLR